MMVRIPIHGALPCLRKNLGYLSCTGLAIDGITPHPNSPAAYIK